MNLQWHPLAEAEFEEAAEWYESQARRGEDFCRSVEVAIDSILIDPTRLPIVRGKVHRCPVSTYPYDVLFTLLSKRELLIVALAHHRRNPTFWLRRGQP